MQWEVQGSPKHRTCTTSSPGIRMQHPQGVSVRPPTRKFYTASFARVLLEFPMWRWLSEQMTTWLNCLQPPPSPRSGWLSPRSSNFVVGVADDYCLQSLTSCRSQGPHHESQRHSFHSGNSKDKDEANASLYNMCLLNFFFLHFYEK